MQVKFRGHSVDIYQFGRNSFFEIKKKINVLIQDVTRTLAILVSLLHLEAWNIYILNISLLHNI